MTSGRVSYATSHPWGITPPHPNTVLGYGSAVFLGRYRDQAPDPLWPGGCIVQFDVQRCFDGLGDEPAQVSVCCSSFEAPRSLDVLIVAKTAHQANESIWVLAWAFESQDAQRYLDIFEAVVNGRVDRRLVIAVECDRRRVVNAEVSIELETYGRRPPFASSARTNATGVVEFSQLPEGVFHMSVRKANYLSLTNEYGEDDACLDGLRGMQERRLELRSPNILWTIARKCGLFR